MFAVPGIFLGYIEQQFAGLTFREMQSSSTVLLFNFSYFYILKLWREKTRMSSFVVRMQLIILSKMLSKIIICLFRSNQLTILAYQPVLPHGLIRIILKINHTTNNYNYLSHTLSSIEYSNIYYKIYIYHNIVAIDFILHHTSMCVWYILN